MRKKWKEENGTTTTHLLPSRRGGAAVSYVSKKWKAENGSARVVVRGAWGGDDVMMGRGGGGGARRSPGGMWWWRRPAAAVFHFFILLLEEAKKTLRFPLFVGGEQKVENSNDGQEPPKPTNGGFWLVVVVGCRAVFHFPLFCPHIIRVGL